MRRKSAGPTVALALLLGSGHSSQADVPVEINASQPAIYIASNGDDRNDGHAPSSAVKTIEHAQQMLRRGSIKRAILLPGIYRLTHTIRLDVQDAGETWESEPSQAIIDGNHGLSDGIYVKGTNNISIVGLTIRNMAANAIVVEDGRSILIDNAHIENTGSTRWSSGGIHVLLSNHDIKITRNLISNSNYAGITVDDTNSDNISGIIVSGNTIERSCQGVADCGAIYINDRSHTALGIRVFGNKLIDFGAFGTKGRAIYLDDLLSNAVVECNHISGRGTYAFQIHAGDHNQIQRNLVDMEGIEHLGLYQDAPPTHKNFGMEGNSFLSNFVVLGADGRPAAWRNRFLPPNVGLKTGDLAAQTFRSRREAEEQFARACGEARP